jgi:hypothetical protein
MWVEPATNSRNFYGFTFEAMAFGVGIRSVAVDQLDGIRIDLAQRRCWCPMSVARTAYCKLE